MHTIEAVNVNDAFRSAIFYLRSAGSKEDTRNGPCLVAPGPVMTVYNDPRSRILWEPRRDANPVFHLMESLWMLAGQRNLLWLTDFNSNFEQYAETGGEQHGAYGFRWRTHFGFDQLLEVVRHLQETPNSRRCVLSMWDPRADLGAVKRDIPCNTHIYFDRRGNKLNMTVCCRSNDALWGAYGANAVHFSILQEVLAHALRVEVGVYRQFSNNMHVYTDVPMVKEFLETPPAENETRYSPMPLLQPHELWEDFIRDCYVLVQDGKQFKTDFMRSVAGPLRDHYRWRKTAPIADKNKLTGIPSEWGVAYNCWIARRAAK